MPTLLVTKNMSRALAARVQASVSGRRSSGARRLARRSSSILRLVALAALAALVFSVLLARQRNATRLATGRAELLARIHEASSALTVSERGALGRLEATLGLHASGAYLGDWVAGDVRTDSALAEQFSAPTVYLRGPLDGLASPAEIAKSAALSTKDALVLCLVDPPPARTEKALRAKARAAYGRGADATSARAIERLEPLLLVLPLLGPDWERRVSSAKTARELAEFQKIFERAPVQAALRAGKAQQILLAVDEPSDAPGPTELDGERAHFVRVVLCDVAGKLTFRVRQRVDPSWISASGRAEYASGIDSCALGLDVRRAVSGREPDAGEPAGVIPAPLPRAPERRRKQAQPGR
jgi:hypothetical protein